MQGETSGKGTTVHYLMVHTLRMYVPVHVHSLVPTYVHGACVYQWSSMQTKACEPISIDWLLISYL